LPKLEEEGDGDEVLWEELTPKGLKLLCSSSSEFPKSV